MRDAYEFARDNRPYHEDWSTTSVGTVIEARDQAWADIVAAKDARIAELEAASGFFTALEDLTSDGWFSVDLESASCNFYGKWTVTIRPRYNDTMAFDAPTLAAALAAILPDAQALHRIYRAHGDHFGFPNKFPTEYPDKMQARVRELEAALRHVVNCLGPDKVLFCDNCVKCPSCLGATFHEAADALRAAQEALPPAAGGRE